MFDSWDVHPVLQLFYKSLPNNPEGSLFWTDGKNIISEDQNANEVLSTFLDECGISTKTGIYERDYFYITNE